MKDVLIKAILNNEATICACDISHIAEQARVNHETMPIGTIALGRTLAAGTMMASMLKNDCDRMTLMIDGGGPTGVIMAVGDAKLNMKGYIANPMVNTVPNKKGQFDISGSVGTHGFVTVIKDMGLKEPYIGKTPVATGEIGEDIAQYFLTSEQQPSIVYVNTWLETDMSVVNAGGIIIRPLPNCTEETLSAIEDRIHEISNYAIYILSDSVQNVLKKIFAGMKLDILKEEEPKWLCDCSKERLEKVVISLGEHEINDMIQKDDGAEIVCRFCNKKYNFSGEELKNLLIRAKK
ncbi:MAG: Hsp33 family molecular chaperone HslO [Christensenellaceae bacterium]